MKKTLAALGAAAVGAVAVRDLTQKQHALKRNFPVIANLRYILEAIGPELRQYIVTGNDDERPFSRDQRRWVYASSKLQNNYFGFGTDNDLEGQTGYPIIKQRTFADVAPSSHAHSGEETPLPCAKVIGQAARPGQGVPAGVDRQHLRHELRLAEQQRDHGAEQGRRARRLPAEHGRGRAVAVPPLRAATSSSRSVRRTSAVATRTARSTSSDSSSSAPVRRSG